ncbi:hypothetical protein SK128_004552, partial [Halocaridina rubra]
KFRATKLFLSNLDYRVTDSDIGHLFSEFKSIVEATVHYSQWGYSLGTAHLVFLNIKEAHIAEKNFQGVSLEGRAMIITSMGDPARSHYFCGRLPIKMRLSLAPTRSFKGLKRLSRRHDSRICHQTPFSRHESHSQVLKNDLWTPRTIPFKPRDRRPRKIFGSDSSSSSISKSPTEAELDDELEEYHNARRRTEKSSRKDWETPDPSLTDTLESLGIDNNLMDVTLQSYNEGTDTCEVQAPPGDSGETPESGVQAEEPACAVRQKEISTTIESAVLSMNNDDYSKDGEDLKLWAVENTVQSIDNNDYNKEDLNLFLDESREESRDDCTEENLIDLPEINVVNGNCKEENLIDLPEINVANDDCKEENLIDLPEINVVNGDCKEEKLIDLPEINLVNADFKEENLHDLPEINVFNGNCKEENLIDLPEVNVVHDDCKEENLIDLPEINVVHDDCKEENLIDLPEINATDDEGEEESQEVAYAKFLNNEKIHPVETEEEFLQTSSINEVTFVIENEEPEVTMNDMKAEDATKTFCKLEVKFAHEGKTLTAGQNQEASSSVSCNAEEDAQHLEDSFIGGCKTHTVSEDDNSKSTVSTLSEIAKTIIKTNSSESNSSAPGAVKSEMLKSKSFLETKSKKSIFEVGVKSKRKSVRLPKLKEGENQLRDDVEELAKEQNTKRTTHPRPRTTHPRRSMRTTPGKLRKGH